MPWVTRLETQRRFGVREESLSLSRLMRCIRGQQSLAFISLFALLNAELSRLRPKADACQLRHEQSHSPREIAAHHCSMLDS